MGLCVSRSFGCGAMVASPYLNTFVVTSVEGRRKRVSLTPMRVW